MRLIDDLRRRYDVPTQSCVLTHVTNTLRAIEQGAPVDLVFQSVAGSERANAGFGISLALLAEAHDAAQSLARGTVGNNVMYFETGQGSALSANAHHDVDQQTMETRAYAVAREFSPLLVNTVVGFYRPGVSLRRQADHPRRAGGPLLRQAAWACRWAATSATPTMPRPTRMTWTRC
ncbi:ethanolamine ammonia-lyase subunit EutB [Cupriavidus basilensis]